MNETMRACLIYFLVMATALFGMGQGRVSAQDLPEYEPGEVVVKLVQTGDLESVAADFQLALPAWFIKTQSTFTIE